MATYSGSMTRENGHTRNRIALGWSEHCLGVAGLLGIILGTSALLSHDVGHEEFALFDLVLGSLELGIALYCASRRNL